MSFASAIHQDGDCNLSMQRVRRQLPPSPCTFSTLLQALTNAGFKSTVRGGGSSSQAGDQAGGPETLNGAQSTSDVMAAKRAAKEAKLRDVTIKLIVGGGTDVCVCGLY